MFGDSVACVGAAGFVLAQAAPDLDVTGGWGKLIATLGAPLALVIFFVFWSKEREKRMADRMDKVEDDRVRLLEEQVTKSTAAQERVATALENNTRAMSSLCDAVKSSRCLSHPGEN